jgi:hypothetical protein
MELERAQLPLNLTVLQVQVLFFINLFFISIIADVAIIVSLSICLLLTTNFDYTELVVGYNCVKSKPVVGKMKMITRYQPNSACAAVHSVITKANDSIGK